MDIFEQEVSKIPIEQRCIQTDNGRFKNTPVNQCFFGVPKDELYGREPLETIPKDANAFHFYFGAYQTDLINAFLRSKYAENTEYLSIGNSSYAMGKGQDYTKLIQVLCKASLPDLKTLHLGTWALFSNSHCIFGYLGDITCLLETLTLTSIESLNIYGTFELTKPVSLPALRTLNAEVDDLTTLSNDSPITQLTFSNLLNAQYKVLEDVYIDLECGNNKNSYSFPERFLHGESMPNLLSFETNGRFADHEKERLFESAIGKKLGKKLDFNEIESFF